MAPDESGARPPPVVLRIKLRYDDVETMIVKFAPNVGKTGLFLPTKSIQPIGAEIKFELRLQTDQPVLVGLARVKASREPDPENPKATFGMAVELMRVTRESRDVILKMLERRKSIGLPDVGIPMPADIDAARRGDFVDTGVSAASGGVPNYIPSIESNPVSASQPFTAPRRQTGPIAVARSIEVQPLAPEAPRKRRPPVAELIASASGPAIAPTEDFFDGDVDVAAVLARARALAGSDLDGELEALRDAMAAPVEIGIEAASAELAKQFGGSAVRRDRSAGWAPPPPTANGEEKPESEISTAVEAGIEPAAAPVEAAPVEAAPVEAARVEAAPVEAVPVEVAREESGGLERESAEREAARVEREAAQDEVARVEAEAAPVEPAAPEYSTTGRRRLGIERLRANRPSAPPIQSAPALIIDSPPVEDSHEEPHEDPVPQRDEPLHRTAGGRRVRPSRSWRRAPSDPKPVSDDQPTPLMAEEPALPAREDDDEPLFERPRRELAPAEKLRTEPASGSLIHDDADPLQFEEAHEVEPEQIHEEIHRLRDSDPDLEEVERTQIGELPVDPHAFAQHGYTTMPSEHAASADRLDAELARAEEDAAQEDLGFSHETIDAGASGGFALPVEDMPQGDYVMPLGTPSSPHIEDTGYRPGDSLEMAIAQAADQQEEDLEEIEEIEDFEILAEADAEDADLMGVAAEREVSQSEAAPPPRSRPVSEVPARPSFLNRLELDEDSGYHAQPAGGRFEDEFSHEPGELDPRILSAGHALRAFEEPDDFNAPGTYTPVPVMPPHRAESDYSLEPGTEDFDAPHGDYGNPSGFVPPDAFDQSDVISIRAETPPAQRAAEEFDLETALEALDVDLDDLGAPSLAAAHAKRSRASSPVVRAGNNRTSGQRAVAQTADEDSHLASSPTEEASVARSRQTGSGRIVTPAATPKSGRVHKRATTEDGIMIDFDDDDQ